MDKSKVQSNGGYVGSSHIPENNLLFNCSDLTIVNVVASVTSACPLPWGGTTPSGTIADVYENPSVTSPATCNWQTGLCTNGVFVPALTYTNRTCTVTQQQQQQQQSSATCSLFGKTYQVGERSDPAYQFIAVKSPKTCESISQTGICGANGQFAPPITYVNETCKVSPNFSNF